MVTLTHLEKTAYHEAGHAVAHIHLNLFFDYVTIAPVPKIQGGLSYARKAKVMRKLDPFHMEQWEKQIIMLYAGCKAIQIKTNDDDDWTGFDAADHELGSDLDRISDFSYFVNPSGPKVDYIKVADKLLREKWPKVEAVAATLLKRKILRYEEVMELINL